MAKISFVGLCGGTQTKVSVKTSKPYTYTDFTELGTQHRSFRIFGDTVYPQSNVPTTYVFEAGISQLADVKLISIEEVVNASSSSKKGG